jgi:hypothetical protein
MCFLDEQEPGVVSDRSSLANQHVHRNSHVHRPRSRDKKQTMSNWVDGRCRHDLGEGEQKRWEREATRTQASGGGG